MSNRMVRLYALLAALLFVTPAAAEDDVATAAIKMAVIEAHCPPFFPRGNAVRAATCRSSAARTAIVGTAPAALEFFDAMTEGNLASAKKFDAGKISAEQYVAETQARGNEFAAKARQAQCNRIIHAMGNAGVTPAMEIVALEKLRNLGCLK